MVKQIRFADGGIYHILNRGVRKSKIFLQDADYLRWELLLDWCTKYNYSYSKYMHRLKQTKQFGSDLKKFREVFDKQYRIEVAPVEILCYVEMPNHFHLVLKQIEDNGVSSFMHRLATAYSMYFNRKYKMSGSLFEAHFKAVLVVTDLQFKQLCRYNHVNPLVAGLTSKEKLMGYRWFSFPSYINDRKSPFLTKKPLLDLFSNSNELYKFTLADFEEEDRKELAGLALDNEFRS